MLIAQKNTGKGETTPGISEEQKTLFMKHLGLVQYVVQKLVGYGHHPERAIERSDLVQYGLIGLLDAVERYDAGRGVQFTTYAVSRIRGTIQDELRKLDWKPRSVRHETRKNELILQQAAAAERSNDSSLDIANRLSLTLEQYQKILESTENGSSGELVPLDAENPSLLALAAGDQDDPAEIAQKNQVRELLYTEIEEMNERDRMVLILYYYEELTFKEIARILRLSESRVFQIHSSVLQELRELLQNESEKG